MTEKDYMALPDGLPVPVDDGAADHLTGARVVGLSAMRPEETREFAERVGIDPVFPPDRNASEVLEWLTA